MKKVFLLATAALLVTAVTFADNGKKKKSVNFHVIHLTCIKVTGPDKPDGCDFQPDASNKPFFEFSLLRAGILVL